METRLAHIQVNVAPANLPFYRDLLAFLGWQTIVDSEQMLGVGDPSGTSLWFIPQVKPAANDYDGPGMNHLSIGTGTSADVDAAVSYLRGRNVTLLFETPRHRPEFVLGEGQSYYQVMFESPDRVLFEIVYTGPAAP